MKRFVAVALAATAFATPAFAQDDAAFTGPRVEAIVGYDNVGVPGASNPDGVLYGVGVGYDFEEAGGIFGVEAELTDSTTKKTIGGAKLESDRDIYVGARVGDVVGPVLLYVKVGYTNARIDVDGDGSNGNGVRGGIGFEYGIGAKGYAKAEYRYSNYEGGVTRNQAVMGFGYRF
ncbi:outer membrane immunogenic protein [Sphingomonas laterariae]|uniref:Outer membrane immunogenic protein n=1 Tax=Edaphosphingomonas laterariae TaxID=861865 RepID=A0A239HJ05_9SPHN|nr:porin family protein [Sphingomonas laterariae]SNS81310.1 outer membrane immunogenic protein [Sphingomonas laterariae]